MGSEENEELEDLHNMIDRGFDIFIVLLVVIVGELFFLIYMVNAVFPIFRF